MQGMQRPPDRRGEALGWAERLLCIGMGGFALHMAARRRGGLGVLLALKGGLMLRRGITGRSRLYRLLEAEPGGLTPFDRRFRVYLATTIHRPREVVREFLTDDVAVEMTCPQLTAVVLGRDREHPVPERPGWAGLLTEHSDEQATLFNLGGDGLAHTGNHLAIELRPVQGGRATQLRCLLRYRPPLGVLGRLVQGSPRARIQRELDRLRQRLEAGVIADATGPRGPGRRNLMAVADAIAEEHLP